MYQSKLAEEEDLPLTWESPKYDWSRTTPGKVNCFEAASKSVG